ncbi:hypothetical protein G3A39_42455 [Paraburkholderia aspalathi]|nr:hypothetical protein [Paraburkholderia aspalathi]
MGEDTPIADKPSFAGFSAEDIEKFGDVGFDVTPRELLEGRLLSDLGKISMSLDDQIWSIDVSLKQVKKLQIEFLSEYRQSWKMAATEHEIEELQHLFDRIRYLSGIYAFQFTTMHAAFLENTLTAFIGKLDTKFKPLKSCVLKKLIEKLQDLEVDLDGVDIDFLLHFYQMRNDFSHNQIEIPVDKVAKNLSRFGQEFLDVYRRDEKEFFIGINNKFETKYYDQRERLLDKLGEHLQL